MKLKKTKYSSVANPIFTIAITAKDLATEMTELKIKNNNLEGRSLIKAEHIKNLTAIERMLSIRGIAW